MALVGLKPTISVFERETARPPWSTVIVPCCMHITQQNDRRFACVISRTCTAFSPACLLLLQCAWEAEHTDQWMRLASNVTRLTLHDVISSSSLRNKRNIGRFVVSTSSGFISFIFVLPLMKCVKRRYVSEYGANRYISILPSIQLVHVI